MKYIHQLTEADTEWWGFNGPGWYHEDETGEVRGPYETEEKADQALKDYALQLAYEDMLP
jgi:hypothetical protein